MVVRRHEVLTWWLSRALATRLGRTRSMRRVTSWGVKGVPSLVPRRSSGPDGSQRLLLEFLEFDAGINTPGSCSLDPPGAGFRRVWRI